MHHCTPIHIRYHLEDSKGDRFTVLPSSGEIIATRPLDREQQAEYHLVVVATDQGIPPRSSSCRVIVYVDDVNDNTPAFEQAPYSQTIMDPTNSGGCRGHGVCGCKGGMGCMVITTTVPCWTWSGATRPPYVCYFLSLSQCLCVSLYLSLFLFICL